MASEPSSTPGGESAADPADAALLAEALELCQTASKLTLDWFQNHSLEVQRKSDGSPVTQADRETEDFLRQELEQRWPDDAIVGEESAAKPGTSGRTWYVDPIDGTKSFACGVPLYATLLAMHDQQGPAIGVICLPAMGEVVYAGRGLGCYAKELTATSQEAVPAKVAGAGAVAGSTAAGAAATGADSNSAPRRHQVACLSGLEYLPEAARQSLLGSEVLIRTWGDAYGYALLATGRVDAMIDFGMNPWDTASMAVVVPEAGGVITSWQGGDAMASASVLAATPSLHPQLAQLLGKVK